MKIKDIKVNDYIQIFNCSDGKIHPYKVTNIYKSKDNKKIFECIGVRFIDKKLHHYSEIINLIHEKNVVGVFKAIEREEK